jgi:hypothetical protein
MLLRFNVQSDSKIAFFTHLRLERALLVNGNEVETGLRVFSAIENHFGLSFDFEFSSSFCVIIFGNEISR